MRFISIIGAMLLVAAFSIAQAPPFSTSATPSPLPALGSGQFSLIVAAGAPTNTPRHAAAAIGLAETVSASQDFFLTVLIAPQPGVTSHSEQTSVVLGMTQRFGTMTIAGMTLHPWASAAFGTALANIQKINLSSTPAATVASAATSASFTAQYVFGFGYKPSWCAKCELGPVARYIHTTGEPSQIIAGLYLKWSPAK